MSLYTKEIHAHLKSHKSQNSETKEILIRKGPRRSQFLFDTMTTSLEMEHPTTDNPSQQPPGQMQQEDQVDLSPPKSGDGIRDRIDAGNGSDTGSGRGSGRDRGGSSRASPPRDDQRSTAPSEIHRGYRDGGDEEEVHGRNRVGGGRSVRSRGDRSSRWSRQGGGDKGRGVGGGDRNRDGSLAGGRNQREASSGASEGRKNRREVSERSENREDRDGGDEEEVHGSNLGGGERSVRSRGVRSSRWSRQGGGDKGRGVGGDDRNRDGSLAGGRNQREASSGASEGRKHRREVSERGENREDSGKVRESGRMERDRGGVDDFQEGSKEVDAPSPVNTAEQREGEKETYNGDDDWTEGSFMTGSYGETYMTGVDGTVYRVQETDDDYFLENSVGDIFSIGDDGEMITVKKGGGEGFPKERIPEKKIHLKRNRDTDEYRKNSGSIREAEQRSVRSMWSRTEERQQRSHARGSGVEDGGRSIASRKGAAMGSIVSRSFLLPQPNDRVAQRPSNHRTRSYREQRHQKRYDA